MDGSIDFIASDHAPCVSSLKCFDTGDFMNAWAGIGGLGLGLSVLWTEGQKRGVTFSKIVKWLSTGPAIHAGLPSKGAIEVGKDADFVIFDPNSEFTVCCDVCFVLELEYITLSGGNRRLTIQEQIFSLPRYDA
jgi:allantoinase